MPGRAERLPAPVGETARDGRVVLFGFEPNYRAFTDGTQKLLRNALLGPAPAVVHAEHDKRLMVISGRANPELAGRIVGETLTDSASQ